MLINCSLKLSRLQTLPELLTLTQKGRSMSGISHTYVELSLGTESIRLTPRWASENCFSTVCGCWHLGHRRQQETSRDSSLLASYSHHHTWRTLTCSSPDSDKGRYITVLPQINTTTPEFLPLWRRSTHSAVPSCSPRTHQPHNAYSLSDLVPG